MMAAMNAATTESRRGRVAGPWNQIIRGGESEPEPVVTVEPSSPSPPIGEDPVGEGSGGGNAGKRQQAWNKQPANGASEVGVVMGAESWPALGEAARVSAKPSSEPVKGLSDGVPSVPSTQVAGTTIATTIATTPTATSSPRKQAHSTSNPNHPAPGRSKTMKRNNSNASSSSSNGSLPQPQEVTAQPFESFSNNPSPRDNTPRSGGFGSNSHGSGGGGGDVPPLRSQSFRNRNGGGGGGPHQRGDGSHHHNYGGRRDHDRGNHEWNSQRSFNGRDSHMHHHRGVPRIHVPTAPPPPPTSSSPFFHPQGLRPFGPPHPMQYPGDLQPQPQIIFMPPHGYVGVTPVPPLIVPVVQGLQPALPPTPTAEAQLAAKIVNQIDYYFSNENLVKDEFLRKKMSIDGGWVGIEVIAGFQKVLELTKDQHLILDALKMAKNVEVQDKFIRKRGDFQKWIIDPPSSVNVSTPRTPVRLSDDNLSARVQSIALEERNPTSSGSDHYSSHQPQLSNGDVGGNSSFSGRS